MRIAIDLRVYNWTGIGRVAKGLAYHIYKILQNNEYIYILNPGQAEEINESNIEKVYISAPTFDFREHLQIWKIISQKSPVDIYHALQFNVPLFLPSRTALVTNVYDLALDRFPDESRTFLHRLYYKIFIRIALKKSSAIIAQSGYTANDLEKFYGYNGAFPINPGFDVDSLDRIADENVNIYDKYQLPSRYILYIGINKPRKNLKALVAAYSTLIENCKEAGKVDLVIAGKMKNETYDIYTDIEKRGIKNRVHLLGFVPDSYLKMLYSNALVYVCPSILESGYSYTILEAASVGTPVLANREDMEGFGGESLFYFDASSVNDCFVKLRSLILDVGLRERFSKAGLKLVESFRWDNYIKALGLVYQECYKEIS